MAKVVVKNMKARELPASLSKGLDAAPDDPVRIIVDATRESDVDALLDLAKRMGEDAARRGLTEPRLEALLEEDQQ